MARTVEYLVYRGGSSNAYNALGPVAIFDGTGSTASERAEDAIRRMDGWLSPSLYRDQYFYARPTSRCSQGDRRAAWVSQEALGNNQREAAVIARQRAADLAADPYAD